MLVEFPNKKFMIFRFNNQTHFQVKLNTRYSIIGLEKKKEKEKIIVLLLHTKGGKKTTNTFPYDEMSYFLKLSGFLGTRCRGGFRLYVGFSFTPDFSSDICPGCYMEI